MPDRDSSITFLFQNLNNLGEKNSQELQRKQKWFPRSEVPASVFGRSEPEAIVRLVYQGRGDALWGLVAPGNRLWGNEKLARPHGRWTRSRTPQGGRVSWSSASTGESTLVDSDGRPVEFSI